MSIACNHFKRARFALVLPPLLTYGCSGNSEVTAPVVSGGVGGSSSASDGERGATTSTSGGLPQHPLGGARAGTSMAGNAGVPQTSAGGLSGSPSAAGGASGAGGPTLGGGPAPGGQIPSGGMMAGGTSSGGASGGTMAGAGAMMAGAGMASASGGLPSGGRTYAAGGACNSGSADSGIGIGGAANEPPILGILSESCSGDPAVACAQTDPMLSLVCINGIWTELEHCGESQLCNQQSGVCAEIHPDCVGKAPGHAVCLNAETLAVCSPDLGTLEIEGCCGICEGGVCREPWCGDGKTEDWEECDDGNSIARDGCEPDCLNSRVVSLSAGWGHTCALLASHQISCWGSNSHGQVGQGNGEELGDRVPASLATVGFDAPLVSLVSGHDHNCVLSTSGDVFCWGANGNGQLGLGHVHDIGDDESPNATRCRVPLGGPAKQIAAGGNTTCAVMVDETVRCWGDNSVGQLGLAHQDDVGDDELPSEENATVDVGAPAAGVGSSGIHACASLKPGGVRCWGENSLGILGLTHTDNIGDDEPPSSQPVRHEEHEFLRISVGGLRCCLEFEDATLLCTGYNGNGQLGGGSTFHAPGLWVTVPRPGNDLEALVSGGAHACVIDWNRQLVCWGLNYAGQLGISNTGTIGDTESLIYVPGIRFGEGLLPVGAAAGDSHTCAVLTSGEVRCWGANDYGQLGLGYVSPPEAPFVGGTPTSTPDLLPSVQVFHD